MKMYKIQKRTTRKKKDCQKASEKRAGQSKKLEGNNMSQRLTIPPDFFRTGVVASTSRNNSNRKEPKGGKDSYVVDNFHGLFDKCLNIRRSERILKRSAQKSNNNLLVGVSSQENLSNSSDEVNLAKEDFHGVFDKCLKLNSYEKRDISNQRDRAERKGKRTLKQSKSIFDEINHLYTRSSRKLKRVFSQENDCNTKFCRALFKQLNGHIASSPKTLLAAKSKIFSEIKKVDNVLSGKVKMEANRPDNRPREYHYEQEENDDSNWHYFSSAEWVYLTPVKQKIVPPKVEDNYLQPAVIYTTKKQTQIFELNANAADLGHFETSNNIAYNKKFMNHLVTLNNSEEMDVDVAPCSSTETFADRFGRQNAAVYSGNPFSFPQTKENDEFMTVFARPEKKTTRPILNNSEFKRKLEEDFGVGSRKANNVRHVAVENMLEIKKKLCLTRGADEFKLNMPKFKLVQQDFSREVDNGNDFAFMEPDSVVGFDFKNTPCCSKNQTGF